MEIDLSGKKIIVTGAAEGIGKTFTEYLINSKATVAIHYNTNKESAELLEKLRPEFNSRAFQADLSLKEEVERLFNEVTEHFGTVNIIIHNAGVFLSHAIDQDIENWYKTWKKTMDINLNAVGLLTKLGINHFQQNGGGSFIFIASRAVFRGETEEYLAYAASKGGMVSLARSVARSFGKQNIKSFTIAPGFTRTRMAEDFIKTYGEEKILNELSLNTLTEPKDIAPLVVMLCSGLMDHATGTTIDINAGSHIR
ncbi:SDR family oxidoreductase [Emticicia sp. CRIBPO]|uniref:SDR family NAD(P)-dependent oxidoreductase n=1 Tax=Emticicia sp. CRIBPO TaxID=2683258 RepID=UPI001412B0DD|nr:SDR family oxidoreductase [Emticicia sp. CRIBPO]NBA85112.1 SDR family oxidoreductase [Emticicia sp. CRIBPO]